MVMVNDTQSFGNQRWRTKKTFALKDNMTSNLSAAKIILIAELIVWHAAADV